MKRLRFILIGSFLETIDRDVSRRATTCNKGNAS